MAEAENTVNTRTQLNPRDSSETDDEGTKAGMTMNKWKKCKKKTLFTLLDGDTSAW